MDSRIGQKDPYYVDVIGTYHMTIFVFAIFAIPHEMATAIGLFLLMILIFTLYSRRRKVQKSESVSNMKLSHLNLMITNFWRFSYLSIVPFILSASMTSAMGDSSVMDQLREQHEAAGTLPSTQEVTEAILQYQLDNASLILWTNLLCFLPLIGYIIAKLFFGLKAFKKNEDVNPKSWSLK